MTYDSLLPDDHPIVVVDGDSESSANTSVMATRDHTIIQRWAQSHQAVPATGEATTSGPKTVDTHDGDAGIRFNFPGVGLYRPISWEEWFGNFDTHGLFFVYERQEQGGAPSNRYRLVPQSAIDRQADR